jgi:hypothetical protein
MRNRLLLIALGCLFLTSCQTGRQYAYKSVHTPKFIDGIYMTPHQKVAVTANVIDTRKVQPKPAPQVDLKKDEEVFATIETKKAPRTIVIKETLPPCVDEPTTENGNQLSRKYAELLGITPENISNPSLYQFIEKWYGSSYRLGGVDETGIDCSGFAQKLYNEIYGIDLNRTAKEQFSTCKRLKHPKEAVEGDLVFFHVHGRRISHVGVYLANNYFVHASSSQGVVISNLKDEYWKKYFAGCGRIKRG